MSGQLYRQGLFFVAKFVTSGQENRSEKPTFLSCKTLGSIKKEQK